MLATQVLNAAAVGVPLDQWLALSLPVRASVIEQHNERHRP